MRRLSTRFVQLFLLVLLLPLAGCEFISTRVFEAYLEPGAPDAPSGVIAYRDQVYAQRGERELLLDVYAPEERGEKALPVILFLFGGGWEAGNRHQAVRFDLLDYATQGYIVVTADYRYMTEQPYPAQIDDVKTAIRWIRMNAVNYGIDPQRIGVIGPSAGGHLAALAGTANRPGELEVGEPSDVPSHVQAVVDYFGPTDFLQGDAHRTEDADPWG
ncbi:MAG: alpha/beta hydrolase, partial [Halioglobus sp.]|nr:alpha/beta hydrolase [Halioglobus sp.]